MKTTEKIVQLNADNDTARKVLNIMGWKVRQQITHWDDGSTSTDSHFEFGDTASVVIGYLGNDGIGYCAGLFNMENVLVGIFNFGDHGDTEVAICDQTRDSLVRISNL